MKVKIRGKLPDHVKDMGVRNGQIYDAEPCPNTRLEAVRFLIFDEDYEPVWCTVLPANYVKL